MPNAQGPDAMPSSAQVIDLFGKYVIGNYTRFPVCLVRGEGSWVWDEEGKRYLDFFPGWGCDLIGHCPPRVVQAVQDQVARLIHVPNTWYMEPQGLLARALVERARAAEVPRGRRADARRLQLRAVRRPGGGPQADRRRDVRHPRRADPGR